jgi:sigma-E factor negative regulatory protein RseC
MGASVCIAQKGIVEEIVDHTIRVRIQRESACGHCNARSMCNLSDISDRIIETHDNGLDLKIGDFVEIAITRSMGHKAVLLGYLLPFLLVITILILLNALRLQEWLSGLISLGMLVPYYMFLYLLRDRLKKSFTFTLSKKE